MTPAARRAAEALPRHRVLLPAGRHRHADPQLRPAGGDRRAVHRQRHRGQRRARRRARQADPADPRRGRRARAPAPRRARGQPADGPHAPAADGPVGAERRPERAGLAVGQLADRAGVLAQSAERRRLQRSRCRRRSTSVDSLDALLNMPVAGTGGAAPSTGGGNDAAARQPRRGDAGARSRRSSRATTSCRRSTSTSACRAPTSRASPAQVQQLVDETRPKLPRGSQVVMRGQVQTMQASFIGLGVGLAMAIVLVYLLIVVNFQSWIDAVIIIAALPAALAGIAWMLFITGTTLSRAGAHRRDHDDGRRHREQHPARLVRAPAPARRARRRCRPRSRPARRGSGRC